MVLDGRADAIITPDKSAVVPNLYPLFDDGLVAVAATSHPFAMHSSLTPDDFVDADYVTYGTTPQPGFEHATFFAPRRVWPRRILRIESTSVLLDIVAAGVWTSVVPRWCVPADLGVVMIPLDPAPPPISWSLATRDLHDNPLVAEAAQRLATALRELRR